MSLNKNELKGIHTKLDKMIESNTMAHEVLNLSLHKNSIVLTKLEEHQRAINGSAKRHDEKLEELDKEININRESIVFARGNVYAIGFISSLLGLIALTKTLGFW